LLQTACNKQRQKQQTRIIREALPTFSKIVSHKERSRAQSNITTNVTIPESNIAVYTPTLHGNITAGVKKKREGTKAHAEILHSTQCKMDLENKAEKTLLVCVWPYAQTINSTLEPKSFARTMLKMERTRK
jgi:hypothetical protein